MASTRTTRARSLRRKETWAERLMWGWLRGRQLAAYKFRRNHPFGKYFLDLYCLEARLAIELDGSGHGFEEQRAHDAERIEYLGRCDIKVLRFWNHTLRKHKIEILDEIYRELVERCPAPGARLAEKEGRDTLTPALSQGEREKRADASRCAERSLADGSDGLKEEKRRDALTPALSRGEREKRAAGLGNFGRHLADAVQGLKEKEVKRLTVGKPR